MDLQYILLNINQFQHDAVIYAQKPWTLMSEAFVVSADQIIELKLQNVELCHFLAVYQVRMLLSKFQTQNLCLNDLCLKIIEEAIKSQHSTKH